MEINEILDKLERGDFDHPNQKGNLFLQVRQHIDRLEVLANKYANKYAAALIKIKAWEKHGEKLKKVIEILKKKSIIKLRVLTNVNGEKIYEIEFEMKYNSVVYELTQQEYELLKEVLGE